MPEPSTPRRSSRRRAAPTPPPPPAPVPVPEGGIPLWFKLAIASVLLTLFVVSYIVDILSDKYEVNAAMYAIVLAVVGFIYGSEAVKGIAKRNGG